MHLQKHLFVCIHFQDSTYLAKHLCSTWGAQKTNTNAYMPVIRDKIFGQRALLAATGVCNSSVQAT